MPKPGQHRHQPSSLVTHLHQTRNPLLTACLPLIFLWQKQAPATQLPIEQWTGTCKNAVDTITVQIQDQGYPTHLLQRLSDILKAYINDQWRLFQHIEKDTTALLPDPTDEPFQQLLTSLHPITTHTEQELDLLEAAFIFLQAGYTGAHWDMTERQRSELADTLLAHVQSKRPIPPADFHLTCPSTTAPSPSHTLRHFFSNLPIRHLLIALGLAFIIMIVMNASTYHRLREQSAPIQSHITQRLSPMDVGTTIKTQKAPYEKN